MRTKPALTALLRSENGAANADWMLLAAALAGTSIALASSIGEGFAPIQTDLLSSLSETATQVAGAFTQPPERNSCPTVSEEGSTTRWTDPAVCSADADQCRPAVFHVVASYIMQDGSEWTANMTQVDGERIYTRWYDGQGTEVPPPCFPG